MSGSSLRIGVDLGGTKIEVVALDQQGAILSRSRRDTPQGNYQETLNTITSMVLDLEESLSAQGSVGVAIPGAVSQLTGMIKNANSVCLNGQPLQQDLERMLERPIRLANDANCFTLSEAVDGAAEGQRVVFGVIIGTGTGGGVVVDRQPLTGRNGIAGEWGHSPLPWMDEGEYPGPACWCGKSGCVETFLSGPGMSSEYRRRTGQQRTAKEIAELAEVGDQAALEMVERYCLHLAKGLAQIINVLDPDAIVLGGGVSNLHRLYQRVPELWGAYVFSDEVKTRLLQARFGDSSGVRGAAWLWENQG